MINTKLLNQGNDLLKKGRYQKALEKFNHQIETGQNLIDAFYNKGIVYQIQLQYEKAIESFNGSLSISPNHINSLILKGIAYCKLGKLEEGIEQFDKVLNLEENNIEALMNKSISLKELKKYEESLTYLNKLIEIKYNNYKIYINKGNIMVNLGKYEEAIEEFKLAIKKDNNSFQAFYNMGICYFYLKKYKDSLYCFQSALKIKPNMIESLFGISMIEIKNKNYENAIKIYNSIIKLEPNNDIFFFKKSKCLKKLGKFDETLKNLDKAIDLNPNNIEYLFEKGKIFDIMDKKDEAIITINKIFLINNKLNNENININNIIEKCHLLKGQILLKKKNNEMANKEFDEVIKINQNNSKAYFYKGYINIIDGKKYNNIAIQNLLKCISLDKENNLALYNLGLVLLNNDQVEESKYFFSKSYEIDKNFFKSLLKLGDAYFKQGKYDLSMKYYEKILKEEPNNEYALNKIGDILLYKNNIMEALNNYEKVLQLNEYNEEALLGKGVCQIKMNKTNDGIIYFDKVLEINEENENAIFNKAIVLFDEDGKKIFKNKIKKSNKIIENPNIIYLNGIISFLKKDYDLAIKNFDKCLKKKEKMADSFYQKGLAFYENKKYELAINSFNQALKEKPDSPNIINSKAIVLEKIHGNKKGALELFKKASETKPENSLYLMNYCLALFENNNFEKCKEILTIIELLYKTKEQMDLLGKKYIDFIKILIEKIKSKLKNIRENKSLIPSKPKKKIEKPIGLINVDLNCYMNSVIQCLFHMTKFSDFFINENFSKEEQPISYELKNIFTKLKNRNNGKAFGLNKLKELMGELDDSFLGSDGADASDLLRYIFSSLNAEFFDDENILNDENEKLDESNEDEVLKEVLKLSNTKCINNIFYFYSESIFLCKNKHFNYSFEYGNILEFNLVDIAKIIKNKEKYKISKISLNECFIYNKLKIDNYKFHCYKCNKNTTGNLTKNLFMTKEYLAILLDYGKNKELNLKIIYDEYINIEEFVEKKNNENFKLMGAVFHYGNSSAYGHYIAYCRNNNNNNFYNFNDSFVKISDFNNILEDNSPYILFYKKYFNKSINYIKYKL